MAHNWQRVPATLYIAYPTFLKFSLTPLSCRFQPSRSLVFLISCFSGWLNGWLCHIWCVILLNDIDLDLPIWGTSVPKRPVYVLSATWLLFHSGLTHNLIFCWYSYLISIRHMPTKTHSETNSLTQPYKHTSTPLAKCSQQLSLLHWIFHWCQKFTFHNVFSLQKLLKFRSHISADYMQ